MILVVILRVKSYNDDKLDGLTRQWYDNKQNILKYEEHYVDDKPISKAKKVGPSLVWSGLV